MIQDINCLFKVTGKIGMTKMMCGLSHAFGYVFLWGVYALHAE